jgi:hypothetical protein
LEDFVSPIEVDVLAYGEDVGLEHRVGHIEMDRIHWQKAIDRGESLFEVCDGNSQGMHDMHVILTDNSNRIREDFEIGDDIEDVLFVHGMTLHPDLKPYRGAILNAAMEPFTGRTLATIWQRTCDLSDRELFDLGFKKIAGESLFARHFMFENRYAKENPNGIEDDFVGTPEHEEWVENELRGPSTEEAGEEL